MRDMTELADRCWDCRVEERFEAEALLAIVEDRVGSFLAEIGGFLKVGYGLAGLLPRTAELPGPELPAFLSILSNMAVKSLINAGLTSFATCLK